jgi:hypothetical protein
VQEGYLGALRKSDSMMDLLYQEVPKVSFKQNPLVLNDLVSRKLHHIPLK